MTTPQRQLGAGASVQHASHHRCLAHLPHTPYLPFTAGCYHPTSLPSRLPNFTQPPCSISTLPLPLLCLFPCCPHLHLLVGRTGITRGLFSHAIPLPPGCPFCLLYFCAASLFYIHAPHRCLARRFWADDAGGRAPASADSAERVRSRGLYLLPNDT